MKIFIINLKRSIDRKVRVQEKLDALSLEYQFFEAVDALEGNHPYLNKYNKDKRIIMRGHGLSKGEVACFASHYSLWKKSIQLSEPILILEDDIIFDVDFKSCISTINKIIPTLGLLKIGRPNQKKSLVLSELYEHYNIVKYTENPSGAVGYAISPETAQKLLNYADEWIDPVDDYMDKDWLHGVSIFGVEPPLLQHEDLEASVIGNRTKPKISVHNKIIRETIRAYEKTRGKIYKYKYILTQHKKIKKTLSEILH